METWLFSIYISIKIPFFNPHFISFMARFSRRWRSPETDHFGDVHVLAVDDSLVDRKVIERLLKITSCKVTAVESGWRALQYLGLDQDKTSPDFVNVDLIITDYCMPGMTGYELLKKIKGSATFREVPVVIMSSENVVARIDRCLEEGAEDFIVKPVKLSDVKRLKDYMFGETRPAPTPTNNNNIFNNKEEKPAAAAASFNKRKLQEMSPSPTILSPLTSPTIISPSTSPTIISPSTSPTISPLTSPSPPPSTTPSPPPSTTPSPPPSTTPSPPLSPSQLESPTMRLNVTNSAQA